MAPLLDRPAYLHTSSEKLRLNLVVSILGPLQAGKTTIARQVAAAGKSHFFDLGDPRSLARLENPATALEPLDGLVIIDEILNFWRVPPRIERGIRKQLGRSSVIQSEGAEP